MYSFCRGCIIIALGQVYEDQGRQEGGGRYSGWADCRDVQQPGALLAHFWFSHLSFLYFPLTLNPQDIIKNQNKDKKTSPEDDFDFWSQLPKVGSNPVINNMQVFKPVKRIRLHVSTIAIWKYTRHEEIYI